MEDFMDVDEKENELSGDGEGVNTDNLYTCSPNTEKRIYFEVSEMMESELKDFLYSRNVQYISPFKGDYQEKVIEFKMKKAKLKKPKKTSNVVPKKKYNSSPKPVAKSENTQEVFSQVPIKKQIQAPPVFSQPQIQFPPYALPVSYESQMGHVGQFYPRYGGIPNEKKFGVEPHFRGFGDPVEPTQFSPTEVMIHRRKKHHVPRFDRRPSQYSIFNKPVEEEVEDTVVSPAPIGVNDSKTAIIITEGIMKESKDSRFIGGKGNIKTPLPRQQITLVQKHNALKNIPVGALIVRVYLLSHNKINEKMKVLCKLTESVFKRKGKKYIINFDELVVKYSSHSNGPFLKLRFSLAVRKNSGGSEIIENIDSYSFKTITKKGIKKREKKQEEKETGIEVKNVIKKEGGN